MDVDATLRYIGPLGRVQNLNCLIYALTVFPGAFQLTGVAFTMWQPLDFFCTPPAGFTPNQTVPGWGTKDQDGCLQYEVRDGVVTDNKSGCAGGWVYETVHGETSAVTNFDLVCDKRILGGTLISSIPLGILVGSYIIGQISDTFGRRPALLISLAGVVAFGSAMSFTWNYHLMFVFGFLLGCFLPGILIVRYVLIIEMYTPNLRLLGHTFSAMPWCLGLLLIGPLAYLLPEWRHFQLVASLPCVLLFLLVWYSHESVRWLVQKGRVDEAEAIIQVIAKSKDVSPPGGKFLRVPNEGFDTLSIKKEDNEAPSSKGKIREEASGVAGESRNEADPIMKRYTVLDLFRTRVLIFRSLVMFYCWFTSNFVYYGFIINITNLAGDKYLNFFLLALTEIPCFIFDYFIIGRFGRRRPLVLFYELCGVACLITAFIPRKTSSGDDLTVLIVVVAMIGKFFITAAFDVTYLVTAEVFPTVLRNIGAGSASVFGRIGGVVAPFVVYLNFIHGSIPLIVFGVVSLVSGLLVLTLPETHNKPLPETLDDGAKLSGNE